MESVLHHTKNTGVLIASDCNARSTLWHDKLTNTRGRIIEEFITSNQLYILNEESCKTTFRNRLGTSNIDLIIINPQLLNSITGWVISDQESASDHSIIKNAIKPGIAKWHAVNPSQIQYRTNKSLAKFQRTILQVLRKKFKINHSTTWDEDLDDSLSALLTEGANIEKLVDDFIEVLTVACNKTFQIHRASRNAPSHRSVAWWSADLTVLRKRANALRILYQRTRNNEELREKRKTQYFKCKATYTATIKREKIRSWKE